MRSGGLHTSAVEPINLRITLGSRWQDAGITGCRGWMDTVNPLSADSHDSRRPTENRVCAQCNARDSSRSPRRGEYSANAEDHSPDEAIAAIFKPLVTPTCVLRRRFSRPVALGANALVFMMEQSYAAIGQAIEQLTSGTEGVDHATNQAILRSTLQQRPVALGYALSTFAGRLRDGERETEQQQCGQKLGGCTTAVQQRRLRREGFMVEPMIGLQRACS